MVLISGLILSVITVTFAGRNNDYDGSLSGHVSTWQGKKDKLPRAYACVNGGYRKWEDGTWSLTAYVPNPQTQGSPYDSGSVAFNSWIYESHYHRGHFGGTVSQCYAAAFCNAKEMNGPWRTVTTSC